MTLPPYTVVARNIDPSADNRIHSDDVAAQFGFAGALVPGVELFAYLTAPLVTEWGLAWLAGGRLDVRFRRPVYDGEPVTTQVQSGNDRWPVALLGPDGTERCVGTAAPPAPPAAAEIPSGRPLPDLPLPTSSLTTGPLGTVDQQVSVADNEAYTDAVCEPSPLYSAEAVAHPGALLRLVNAVLMRNVELGPWIHTASACRFLAPARLPAMLSTRATVTEIFERNGSSYVRYNAVVVAGALPVMQVQHTAIYRLGQGRPVDAAAHNAVDKPPEQGTTWPALWTSCG